MVLATPDTTFNYSLGAVDEVPPLVEMEVPRKNSFTFDLGGITEEITGATRKLYVPSTAIDRMDGFSIPDASKRYVISGTPTAGSGEMAGFASEIAAVLPIAEPPALDAAMMRYGMVAGILEDPGLPSPFGGVEITAAENGTVVMIAFVDPIGIDYLDLFAGGPVVFGGNRLFR